VEACTGYGESPPASLVGVGGGVMGLFDGTDFGYGTLLYRSRHSWKRIHAGALAGFAGHSRYVAVNLVFDCDVGRRFRLTLSSGPGLYEHEDPAPNLGSPVEFLSTLELSWRVHRDQRLALALGHLSNAHLAPYNPGTEVATLVYLIPLH